MLDAGPVPRPPRRRQRPGNPEIEDLERIIEIEIERLRPFKEHPFQVKDDSSILLYLFSILLLVVQSLLPVYVLSIPTEFLISYL